MTELEDNLKLLKHVYPVSPDFTDEYLRTLADQMARSRGGVLGWLSRRKDAEHYFQQLKSERDAARALREDAVMDVAVSLDKPRGS